MTDEPQTPAAHEPAEPPRIVRSMTVVEARRELVICQHGAVHEEIPMERLDCEGMDPVPGARVVEWSDGRLVLEAGIPAAERTVTLPSEPESES